MIYLDYNATSKIFPEILPAIAPVLGESFGNPSSVHAKGRQAREAVESVRRKTLEALGDREGQIVFTSGGTEADNLALRGVICASGQKGAGLIVSSVEHEAVLHTARRLEEEGTPVSIAPVDAHGVVDQDGEYPVAVPRGALSGNEDFRREPASQTRMLASTGANPSM